MVRSVLSASGLAREALTLLELGDVEGAKSVLSAAIDGTRQSTEADVSLDLKTFGCMFGPAAMHAQPGQYLSVYSLPTDETILPPSPSHARHAVDSLGDLEQQLEEKSLQEILSTRLDELVRTRGFLRRCVTLDLWFEEGSESGNYAYQLQAKTTDAEVGKSELRPNPHLLTQLLTAQTAQTRTDRKVALRLLHFARKSGMNQRQIAKVMMKPQTAVFRELRAIDENPSLIVLSPREIYDYFLSGQIGRLEMLEMLAAYPYASGSPVEEEPDWGFLPGSWDELSQLAIDGSITQEELEAIVAASDSIEGADA